MKIDDLVILAIEYTFQIKLYDHQKAYLKDEDYMPNVRANGKTFAYCIKLALSEGEPLNIRKPEEFSDYGPAYSRIQNEHTHYSRTYFIREFMRVREVLKERGFPVRQIKK